MAKSRIPLIGLANKVDVIRRIARDDGAGGIDDEGGELVIYANLKARTTSPRLSEREVEELAGVGFTSSNGRKVLLPVSPQVRLGDFVRVHHGNFPNIEAPIGAPTGTAEIYTLTHPTGTSTLTWDETLLRWANTAAMITLSWDGTNWVFDDTVNSYTDTAPITVLLAHNVTKWTEWAWNSGTPSGYVLVDADPVIDYRVVWRREMQDDVGGLHHTSLIVEEEDDDT